MATGLLLALSLGCAPAEQVEPSLAAAPSPGAASEAELRLTETDQTAPSPGAASEAPALALDKLGVDLGTVARDQQGTVTFLVMNRGKSLLRVEPPTISAEEGCTVAETAKEGATIQPGEVVVLPIKLGQHQRLGPHRLTVGLASNDPLLPVATASVRFAVAEAGAAEGKGPRLQVDKEVVDIGTVPFDWPLYEQFTLRNVGDAPLVLEGATQVRVEKGC